jgi:NAD(P)-dependent dehydrogenase (short-subunit alcohol dehydrogenase family)
MKISDIGHAFITGGASGIGLGTARGLAARGVAVTIADFNHDALDDVLGEGNARLRAVHMDVRDRGRWAQAKTNAEAAFGPVDLLFNNAGIASTGYELADMDPESFDRIVGVNLVGTFNGISTFAADMRDRRRGHIVSTSSIVGIAAPKHGVGGSYVASKFGIVGLSEVLRMEMAPHGVDVSVLCPGHIATGMGRNPIRNPKDARKVAGLGDKPGGRVEDLVPSLLAGIEAGKFYIISHCENEWNNVEARSKELEKTFNCSGDSSIT